MYGETLLQTLDTTSELLENVATPADFSECLNLFKNKCAT
jgi:hypothetical protein